MFLIPGSVISFLTFPGVIVHEMGHKFFADELGVPVYKVRYFRFGNPAGYVVHGAPDSLKSSFLISVGPFILNTLFCFLSSVSAFYFFPARTWPFWLLMWVSISIGMHAFPSNEDMDNFVDYVKHARFLGLLIPFAYLFALIFKLANYLRFFWFDAVYAAAIALLLPYLLGVRL